MGVVQNFQLADRKKKVIIITTLVLILLIIILLGYMIWKLLSGAPATQTPAVNQPVVNQGTSVITDTLDPIALQTEITRQQTQGDVTIVAEPFLERFGSYNNQGDFSNFTDIEVYMTASLAKWVKDSYYTQLRAKMPPIDQFYAINTKVLTTEVVSLDEEKGEAEVLINAQRQEQGAGGVTTNIYYQEGTVKLLKIEGEWKVDGVFWAQN
jgi:cytoskeletal protein RodZ